MINLKRMLWDVRFRGCPDPIAHIKAIRTHYANTLGQRVQQVAVALRDCQTWHPHRCRQCDRPMNPVDYFMGPVCMACCKANHRAAVGR